MQVITFKNEKQLFVSQVIVDKLSERILSGANQWQTFSDELNNTFLILNLNEIVSIVDYDVLDKIK